MIIMLDLTARYEPGQETFPIRSVTASNKYRKPTGKNDSFNHILNTARQFSQDLKPVNTKSDKSSDVSKLENISVCPTKLDKSEKTVAASPAVADKPNVVDKQTVVDQPESDQSLQLASVKISQEATEQDQSGANTENDAELLTNMSQAELVPVEVLDQSSSVGLEASMSSVVSKNPTDIQIEVPLNETQPLTAVPAQQEIDLASQRVSLKSGMETVASLLNELKASGQDLPVSQSATQAQQMESQTEPVQLEQNASNLATATTAKKDMADLINIQTNSAAIPVLVDGRAMSNTTAGGDLAFVAQAPEMAQPVSLSSQKSDEQDLANQGSTTASGAEDAKSEKVNKALPPEDLRFKLIAKTLSENKESDDNQPATDIKKLLTSESQRLSAAKSVTETSTLTETPAANSQTETLPTTVSGLEKAIHTTVRTGLESQTNASQSPASTVDPEDLIEQIVKKVEMLSKASNSEIKIQLKPEFMGKMIIKIAVEDGLVTAKFITESQHVKQLLEANLGSLRQNLESQGLKVDRTEVNVQLDNGGSFHGNDSGRQQMWEE